MTTPVDRSRERDFDLSLEADPPEASIDDDPEDVVARMPGCFAFSAKMPNGSWHATDRFATVPIYYLERPDGPPLASTRIADLLGTLDRVDLDPMGFVLSSAIGAPRTDRTAYVGVRRVPPGHILSITDGRARLKRYWSLAGLVDKVFDGTREDAADELSRLLRRAIGRASLGARRTALHVSGGIDSGSVAAIACRSDPDDWQGYSIVPVRRAGGGSGYEDERVRLLAEHLPNLRVHEQFFEAPNLDLIPEPDNWQAVTIRNAHALEVEHAASAGRELFLTGLGGDEMASASGIHRRWLPAVASDGQARLASLAVTARLGISKMFSGFSRSSGFFGFRPPDRRARETEAILAAILDIRKVLQPDLLSGFPERIDRHYRSLASLRATGAYRRSVLDRCRFTHRPEVWSMLGRRHRVRYDHPLLDRDVVEFVTTLPGWITEDRRGGKRALFRRAVTGLLPPVFREAWKRPTDQVGLLGAIEPVRDLGQALDVVTSRSNGRSGDVYDTQRLRDLLSRARATAMEVERLGDAPSEGLINLTFLLHQIARRMIFLDEVFGRLPSSSPGPRASS